jgi:hypothetical protein
MTNCVKPEGDSVAVLGLNFMLVDSAKFLCRSRCR